MKTYELSLKRTYHAEGTNGILSDLSGQICFTIEKPWRKNRRGVSCIPEGRYRIIKRWSEGRGNHLLLLNVPDRDLILIHPANDAEKELRGCIAPVTFLTGKGRGGRSRDAMEKVRNACYKALDEKKRVWITITENQESI